jgi:hypothetical protein
MLFVQFALTAFPCQIEDFPAEVPVEGKEPRKFERSCEGALHVRPGSSATITADELAHIRENHPKVFATVRVLVDEEQMAAPPAEAPKEAPATPPTVPDLDQAGASGSGGGESDEAAASGSKKSGKR